VSRFLQRTAKTHANFATPVRWALSFNIMNRVYLLIALLLAAAKGMTMEYILASNDAWTVVEGSSSGIHKEIRYRPNLVNYEEKTKFPKQLTIIWKYEPAKEAKGLPYSDDLDEMQDFETKLTDVFEKEGVALITHIFTSEGEREFNFYANDIEKIGGILNDELAPGLPIKISIGDGSGWDSYLEIIDMVSE
jgi:hypothetical protein